MKLKKPRRAKNPYIKVSKKPYHRYCITCKQEKQETDFGYFGDRKQRLKRECLSCESLIPVEPAKPTSPYIQLARKEDLEFRDVLLRGLNYISRLLKAKPPTWVGVISIFTQGVRVHIEYYGAVEEATIAECNCSGTLERVVKYKYKDLDLTNLIADGLSMYLNR